MKTELQVEIEMTHRGYANHKYLVRKTAGNWPKNSSDLIAICDNHSLTDLTPRHFGGSVELSENVARVTVYVD